MTSSNETFFVINNQNYQKIKEECLKSGKRLWEDVSYEATYDERPDWDWKRPGEIVGNPRFVDNSTGKAPIRFDLKNLNIQEAANKYIIKNNLASLSALSLKLGLFRFVVPEDNVEFSDQDYVGLFHFRFWRYGKFYDIVVDDRLPTRGGKLVSFLKDGKPGEFWPFLLEKAYTKLFGSTESLTKTTIPELLVDLTGGISETCISLGHTKPLLADDLDKIFCKALEKESIIIFGRHWPADVVNMEMTNVYCITEATYVNTEKFDQILLLRIFMPFVTDVKEWQGENSEEWQSILKDKKDIFNKVQSHEFWMTFSEFKKHDWDVYIVHWKTNIMATMCEDLLKTSTWFLTSAVGKWVKGVTSGGNRHDYLETTFYLNPQYAISLKLPDSGISDCNIIASIMLKTHKSDRVPMHLYIFELKHKPEERLSWDFFKHCNPIVDSFPRNETREITRRCRISPGEYCIVVAPNESYQEANFLLRVFSEQILEMSVLNEKVAQKDVDVRVSRLPFLDDQGSVLESDKKVYAFFDEVSGEDKVVGWKELKRVLDFAMDYEKPKSENYVVRNSFMSYVFPSSSVFDTMDSREFSKDVARSLLATADIDHSGKLTLQEFQGLWAQIRQWIKIYELYSDDNGYLPKEQLREALDSAGFQLNNDILCSLAIRYTNKDNVIPFDDFLICASKLRTVFDYYRYKDPEFTDQAAFTLEEWLQKSIYS